MKYKSGIDYFCGKAEAENLYKCILPEVRSHKSERASVSLAKKKEGLNIIIESDDITALRAAFNSMTKLLSVYAEMKKIK